LNSGGIAGMMTQIVGDAGDATRAAGYAEQAKKDFYICSGCGYTAKGDKPVACPICAAEGSAFQFLDKLVFEAAARAEGGLEQEIGYDGVPLAWTEEAKNVLRKVPAGFERRRAKAKVEKTARKMGFQTIAREFAVRMIEGVDEEVQSSAKAVASVALAAQSPLPQAPSFNWTPEAAARLERVPVGFMRDATRQHIENHAYSQAIQNITLDVAEAGIKKATDEMESVLSGATSLDDVRKRLAGMSMGQTVSQPEETFHFCGMCGHTVRQTPEQCPVCETGRNRFLPMEKGVDYFICAICSQISRTTIPDPCLLCGAGGEYAHPLERRESVLPESIITWSDAAEALIAEIPAGMMRDMTRWRIEATARKKAIREITPEVIEAKYREWAAVSRQIEKQLEWDRAADARMNRIPSFVRGTVAREIEACAREQGLSRVTEAMLDEVTARWTAASWV